MIYLISQLWIDKMENKVHAARGYSPYKYTDNQAEAAKFCNESKIFTEEDCWAILGKMNEFIYEPINKL